MATESSFLKSRRVNWRYVLIALAIPIGLVVSFAHDTRFAARRPPPIIYAESWPASRTPADAARVQRVNETARQAEGAKFEIERGQALLLRADTPATRAAAEKHIAESQAALAAWQRAHDRAVADVVLHPAPSLGGPPPAP